MKVEQIFSCHELSERRKVKLATLVFTDYAMMWWDKLVRDRREDENPQVASWTELMRVMRKWFVPRNFMDGINEKLYGL